MTEQKNINPHILIIENRDKMSVSGVIDVDSFDDETVVLLTEKGRLTIKGASLKVNSFAVETGDLNLSGKIMALGYLEDEPKKKLLGRLFG